MSTPEPNCFIVEQPQSFVPEDSNPATVVAVFMLPIAVGALSKALQALENELRKGQNPPLLVRYGHATVVPYVDGEGA